MLTALGRGGGGELSVICLGESNEVTHSGPHSQGSRGTSLKKSLRDLHLKAAAHKQENEAELIKCPFEQICFLSLYLQEGSAVEWCTGSGARYLG